MRARLVLCGALAVLSVVLFAAPAMAGGWAVSTLDSLPPDGLNAGQSYPIGFTMRQHGVSPFTMGSPEIRIRSADGQHSFRAVHDGNGHYTANVQFPREGTWTWMIDQVPFATQELGTIEVRPVGAAPALPMGPVAEAAPSASVEQSVLGYMLAGLLAVVVLVWRRPFFGRGVSKQA